MQDRSAVGRFDRWLQRVVWRRRHRALEFVIPAFAGLTNESDSAKISRVPGFEKRMIKILTVAGALGLSLLAATAGAAQASRLRALCAFHASAAGLQGAGAMRFERRCAASPVAAIVFADPACRQAAQATIASAQASSLLDALTGAQRQAGEACRIEHTMFDVNDAMLSLIDARPSHCGHSAAGLELMRASQRAMKGMGC